MGPIVDRTNEHLGPADRAIIATRQLLLDWVEAVQTGGSPPGTDTSYYSARAIEKNLPRQETWRETVLPEMYAEDLPVASKIRPARSERRRACSGAPPLSIGTSLSYGTLFTARTSHGSFPPSDVPPSEGLMEPASA